MSRPKSLIRIILEPLLVALVLAMAVRTVVTIYSVPSESMAPALQPGDRIVVTRFPGDRPERGDVIVFRHPFDPHRFSVKRVIGVPGDLVESAGGRVRIRGRSLPQAYGALPQGAEISPQLVPEGHLFVLGDNHAHSYDSRHWGPLPSGLVAGRARIILWQRHSTGRIFKWVE
ncbi:MAG TPA: signal peptidase I [Thermoanaerobaculia bacterium]|nr:signal peptidase I [Thermoanaerobaculia bacterium]